MTAIVKLDQSEQMIGALAEELERTQDYWEQIDYLHSPSVICDECGGRGTISAGSLGDAECWKCDGQRVRNHPDAAHVSKVDAPPFVLLRGRLNAARKLLEDGKVIAKEAEEAVSPGTKLPVVPDAIAHLDQTLAKLAEDVADARKHVDKVKEARRRPAASIADGPRPLLDRGDERVVDAELDEEKLE